MACRAYEKNSHKVCNRVVPRGLFMEKRQHKKYNKITNIRKGINYDIKHGVTNEEVISFMDEVRNNSSFHGLRKVDGSIDRLDEIEKEFTSSISPARYQW